MAVRGAGDLKTKVTLQIRGEGNDGYGNRRTDYVDQFSAWADIRFLRGGEGVVEARLTSKQPAILTLRSSARSRGIAPHWRVVAGDRAYLVKEPPRLNDMRAFVEVLIESEPVGG